MSDFLQRLVKRTLTPDDQAIRPRLPARFESLPDQGWPGELEEFPAASRPAESSLENPPMSIRPLRKVSQDAPLTDRQVGTPPLINPGGLPEPRSQQDRAAIPAAHPPAQLAMPAGTPQPVTDPLSTQVPVQPAAPASPRLQPLIPPAPGEVAIPPGQKPAPVPIRLADEPPARSIPPSRDVPGQPPDRPLAAPAQMTLVPARSETRDASAQEVASTPAEVALENQGEAVNVQVNIGRIEVRLAQSQASKNVRPARNPVSQRKPLLSLDDYLKQRKGGKL